MQNEKNKTYQLKVEKMIRKSPEEVFRAIGAGRLFLNCGASSEALKVDFRVGGKYSIAFPAYGVTNHGEFLEVVPHGRIVFTWCEDAKANDKPNTVVTVELREKDRQTHLTLTHVGFTSQALADQHEGGWKGGLGDLGTEMVQGQLKFNRFFEMSVAKLFDLCKTPATFFGELGDLDKGQVDFRVGGAFRLPTENGEIRGKFTEIAPGKKIAFTWDADCDGSPLTGSQVTLTFEPEDDEPNESWLELIHEGLPTEGQQMSHRAGWDYLLNQLRG